MKLGSKSRDVDSFVDQLKNEGEQVVASSVKSGEVTSHNVPVRTENMLDVHLKMEDKLSLRIGRDGGIQNFELTGLLTLRISDEEFGRIRVHINNEDTRGIQLQVCGVE